MISNDGIDVHTFFNLKEKEKFFILKEQRQPQIKLTFWFDVISYLHSLGREQVNKN